VYSQRSRVIGRVIKQQTRLNVRRKKPKNLGGIVHPHHEVGSDHDDLWPALSEA
jgi:hypothetical protein